MDKGSVEHHKQLLGEIYRSLQIKSVGPDHPLYVNIWEGLPYDPVARMRNQIEWSEIDSLQLFSGFSGAGKTTQLLRLKKELTEAGYLVIYADAEDYLNLGEALDISDLLYTVAGAFSDGLEQAEVSLPKGESYWTRFHSYLTKTKVEFKEFAVSGGLELKGELQTSTTFRQRLQEHLSGHLRELASQTHDFIKEGLAQVREKYGTEKRVVFLLDSLEKLRATPSNEQEMMDRLERLFRNHLHLLEFEWLHCVYTVPAWLREVISYSKITLIPSIKLLESRDSTIRSEHGWTVLRNLVQRRLGRGSELVFGGPVANGGSGLADRLIEMSGGAPRDLLRLFQELVVRARPDDLPVGERIVESAIAEVRNEMRISVQDARWLEKVARTKAAYLPTSEKRDVNHYMRLLDNHFILCFRNDSDWYDVHPLIRDEVERIISLHPERVHDD